MSASDAVTGKAEPIDSSRHTEAIESLTDGQIPTAPRPQRTGAIWRALLASIVCYVSTVGLSLVLAIVLVYVAASALATALGGTPVGSPPASTGSAPQLSFSDLGTLVHTLVSFTGYTFFASHLTPIEASAFGGATYGVIGIGSATIALVAILVPFAFARRSERAIPSLSALRAASRGLAIAVPYWIGALALYLASFISVGDSQLGASLHPSGLALVIPALLVGIGGALGAASMRQPGLDVAESILRGLARASIAIVVGILATVAVVSILYALQAATNPSSTSPANSLQASPAARDLGWGLLALVPFYLLNGAGIVWSAVLGGVLFKGTASSVIALLGPALGALVGATQLRRGPDRAEQISFALGFGAFTLLIYVATTPAIINGPSMLPAPTTIGLVSLAFGAIAALISPYLLSLRPVSSIAASRPVSWAVRPILTMWPPERVLSPGVGDGARPLSMPRLGRVQVMAAGVLIVLTAGGLIANSQLSSRFSPERAAFDYLDAQRRGDSDAMWSIASYQSASGTGGELLSKAALAKMLQDPANRDLSGIQISDSTRADDSNYTITVQLRRDGRDSTLALHVRKNASKSNWLIYPAWRVVVPASNIEITTFSYAGAVTVDGFAAHLRDASGSVEVIPGHHKIVLEPTDIFAGDSQVVDATTDADATFKATLTSAATTAVNKAIGDLFARCAAVHQVRPAGCPNYSYALGDHQSKVAWRLLGDPTASMQLAIGDQIDTITARGQWKMHLSYTYGTTSIRASLRDLMRT